MKLERVQHLKELEDLLDIAGVDKDNIILYGSSIMALYGIKENNDLELIPHPDVKSDFMQLAKESEDIEINHNGQIHFPGDVRVVYEGDKFAPFGWDDYRLFEDQKCCVECEGYKFAKLELLVSLKACKRRSKDLEHLEMLEDQGYIGGQRWDWDLVHHLPPWERPERPSKSLLEIYRDSMEEYGVFYTLLRGPVYLASKIASKAVEKSVNRNENLKEKLQKLKESLEPYIRRKNNYAVPYLLNRQLNDEGEFKRYDLIACILYLQGDETFQQFFEEIDEEKEISVTPKGSINGGIVELARKLDEFLQNTPELSDSNLEVKISKRTNLSAKDSDWAEKKFGEEKAAKMERFKEELLEDAGIYFYAMLWPSLKDYHDDIESWIRERIDVIETLDLELGDDMHEFLESVYSVDERPQNWEKERKITKIQKFGSEARILKIRVDKPDFWHEECEPISNKAHSLKQECRKEFQDKLKNYEYGIITHFTDNYTHNAYIAKILSDLD